jgi:phosphopantetheine adenylyltransferase
VAVVTALEAWERVEEVERALVDTEAGGVETVMMVARVTGRLVKAVEVEMVLVAAEGVPREDAVVEEMAQEG